MATPFESIIDKALVSLRDYKLDDLMVTDSDTFEQVMVGYVIKATPKFIGCLKELDYTNNQFNADLTMKEIDILADLVILTWWESHYNDVLVYQEALRDADFNKYATGQNMKERQNTIDSLREKVRQDMTDYQMMGSNLSMLMGV